MGGPAKVEVGLTAPDHRHPTQRLIVTPRREVDILCRLALLHALGAQDAGLAILAEELAGEGTPDHRVEEAAYERIRCTLLRLRVVDPACGEGHVLVGMLDLLDRLLARSAAALGIAEGRAERRSEIVRHCLYGVEAQGDRLQVARRRLADAAGDPEGEAVLAAGRNLVGGDSLVEREGFRWETSFPDAFAGGGFHLVIGNPPYVRHEQIDDPLRRIPASAYKPLAFAAVESVLQRRLGLPPPGGPAHPLSRRSDLSALFIASGLTLLRPGGVLGYVVPNAISSTSYGERLLRMFAAEGIELRLVENLERRAFASSAVNTSILLACRPRGIALRLSSASQPGPAGGDRPHTPPLPAPPTAAGREPLLERIESRCRPLQSFGRVRYPLKTGLNRFFYPDAETRARFALEERFLLPVVKSPRHLSSLEVVADDLSTFLFHCALSPAELREGGWEGALAYVRWGERQTCAVGAGQEPVPWPEVPSLRGRDPWYALPLPAPAGLLCPRFLYRRLFLPLPAPGMVEDQTLYGLVLSPAWQGHRLLVGALLNCSFGCLMLETHGRTALGEGVRQYALRDAAALPVLDPARLRPEVLPPILQVFARLARRPVGPIDAEVTEPDRTELDELVCQAADLSQEDGAAARDLVVRLVERRLSRARTWS